MLPCGQPFAADKIYRAWFALAPIIITRTGETQREAKRMRSIRSLIGMPVVVANRRLGRVIQIALSDDLTRAEGIWLDAGLRGTRYVPMDSVRLIGSVAITADDAGKRRAMRAQPLFRRAISTDGQRIGAITGAEINALSFQVEALEVSVSVWSDLLYGRAHALSFTADRENGSVIIDWPLPERTDSQDEERNDEGTRSRRTDRLLRCDSLWDHELADCKADEPTGSQNRRMAFRKSGKSDR